MQENLDHDIIISVIKSQLHELGTAAKWLIYNCKIAGNSHMELMRYIGYDSS